MRTVATLVYDAVNPFEVAVAAEVFGVERPELGVPWYRFMVCAVEPRPIQMALGLVLSTAHTLDDAAEADTIIVPGARPTLTPAPPVLLEMLRRGYVRGARLVALCTGTFLLAEAGLLDGRRASTHWAWAAELAARYPRVRVDARALYIDDGQVLTSAGTAAAIDLSLHVVRKDYGAEVAARLARRMVVPPHREGGQAQYIETPIALPEECEEPFARTMAWMAAHLDEELTVEDMAARAVMSPRTFARRFHATMGTTPHQWLLRQRIMLARRLLETTDEPVELVAVRCGFRTAAAMRPHFQRLMQTAPLAYRGAFRRRVEEGAMMPAGETVGR